MARTKNLLTASAGTGSFSTRFVQEAALGDACEYIVQIIRRKMVN